MKSFVISLFLLLGTLSAFSAEQAPPKHSVVIVFDLSYSMRLSAGKMSRLNAGRAAVDALLSSPESTETEWALVLFDDTGAVFDAVPFTRRPAEVRAALKKAEYWALSPIGEALEEGLRLAAGGRGEKALVLVSDCVPSPEPDLPNPSAYRSAGVPIYVLGFKLTQNPSLQRAASEWAESLGGDFFTSDQVSLLKANLFASPKSEEPVPDKAVEPEPPPQKEVKEEEPAPEPLAAKEEEPLKPAEPELRTKTSYAVSFVPARYVFSVPLRVFLMVPAAVFLILSLTRILASLRSRKRKLALRRVDRFPSVEIEYPDERREAYKLPEAKAVFGNVAGMDLSLPGFSLSGRKKSFITLSQAGKDSVRAVFSVPVIFNGVATREMTLGLEKPVFLGGYRFTYLGIVSETIESDMEVSSAFGIHAPFAAVLLLLLVFIPAAPLFINFPLPKVTKSETVELVFPAERKSVDELEEPDAGAEKIAEELPAAEENEALLIEHEENGSSSSLGSVGAEEPKKADVLPLSQPAEEPAVRKELVRAEVRVFPPGAAIDEEPVDVLFIHAHPDDESLDFGVLIARASRAGKRVAMAVLTDGEGGIDQYPRRVVGGSYPARDMAGSELSRVRTKEAEGALSVLGCPLYVRLGFRNDPYNNIKDVRTLKTKLGEWGGEEASVDAVYRVIRALRPVLVVSPDISSKAREHYEHEAAGWVARKAVDRALAEKGNTVKAHITSVDPLQRGFYPNRFSVNAVTRDEESGLSFRDIQAQALLEHKTQRDASVIGVEVLKNYRSEFYQIRFWNLSGDIESFLSK